MSVVTGLSAEERKEAEYLESLAGRLRTWRLRQGKSYFSMPTALWEEAIAVARKKGLGFASRKLGLNRDELKRRMGLTCAAIEPAAAVADTTNTAATAEFIELPGLDAPLLGTPKVAPAQPSAKPVADVALVQITATDGARLAVRIPITHLDLASLVHTFRHVRT